MKISKTMRFTINNRQYENATVEVGAEATHHDLGFTDDQWAEVVLVNKDHAVYQSKLEDMVLTEVEKLAVQELRRVERFCENSDNLARDYLNACEESSPTNKPRSQHARDQETSAQSSSRRRLRRGDPQGAA
jgi:hypothetical protein